MATTSPKPTKQTNVTEKHDLESFNEIWYQLFLYCLAVTVLMHGLAALLALRSLRKHKFGRYLPIVFIVAGFLYPLTGGIITSCMIAWVYSAAGYPMARYYAFVYGGGQSFMLFVVSFARIYGTL